MGWRGKAIVISNFDKDKQYTIDFKVPSETISKWGIENEAKLKDQLYGQTGRLLINKKGEGEISLKLAPLQSYIFKIAE